MRKLISALLFIFAPLFVFSQQIGGSSTYEFLNLPVTARVAAFGGNLVPIWDNDQGLAASNPSLLNSGMSNKFTLNYVTYFSDINYGSANYSRSFDKLGNFSVGFMTINYGDFIAADVTGEITGDFGANENSFYVAWSKPIDSLFQFGVNLKGISSNLESYYSYGIAADVGVTYHSRDGLFTSSVLVKNIGTQMETYYTAGEYEPLPFEIEAGFSKKLNHAPFRFSIIFQHLESFDTTYDNPNDQDNVIDPLTGEVIPENDFEKYSKMMFDHLIIAAEFLPSEHFFAIVAYNAQRRNEMTISAKSGTVGFSWGVGMKYDKFSFSYGRARYHLAGGSNHFTLTTNLSSFYRKA